MDNNSVKEVAIKKVSEAHVAHADDHVAVEEPLEISLLHGPPGRQSKKVISVTMRTPGNDEELGLGFLFTEGILRDPGQITRAKVDAQDNSLWISVHPDDEVFVQNTERNFYTTSSCGVCGKASIDAVHTVSVFPNAPDNISLNRDVLFQLTSQLEKKQPFFQQTGGLHASALFDLNGNFMLLREDVGRHNALDKVIGASLKNKSLPLDDKILFLSGRAGFELIQKAWMAGIKIVAAVGAPSSLAIDLANESGITLVGFLRNDRFNIYSGSERITVS